MSPVTWANGQSSNVGRDSFSGGVAHYQTTLYLNSTVTEVTASIYYGWSGSFVLSHGPCPSTPTSTPTATATRTRTATITPTPCVGSVSGYKKNEAGAVLAGWTIKLLDNSKNVLRTTTTNASGYYQFVNIPAGPNSSNPIWYWWLRRCR